MLKENRGVGGPEAPGYLRELGFKTDYIYPKTFDKAGAIAALKAKFGIGEELIQTYLHPYLYLNHNAIAKAGLERSARRPNWRSRTRPLSISCSVSDSTTLRGADRRRDTSALECLASDQGLEPAFIPLRSLHSKFRSRVQVDLPVP